MNEPGGGPDIAELLRGHGKEAIYRLAESAGLKRSSDGRLQCPFDGCRDKGPNRSSNVKVFAGAGGKFCLHCHSCAFTGDLLDMLEAVHQWSKAEAIAHLRGTPVAPRPNLRIVAPAPTPDPEKLKPAEVTRIWKTFAEEDELGRGYLEGRLLGGSPLVRFATEKSDAQLRGYVKHGRRIAMLLTDVVGERRGIQLRLARAKRGKEDSQISLKGSTTKGAFFGAPELIEASPVILVAEGMADTIALQLWAPKDSVVVGAPGIGNLPVLAESLKAANIPLEGKTFALFTQNDRPVNKSRKFFVRLSQLLLAAGANVVLCNSDKEFEDLADWRKARPDVAWPPAELERAFGDEVEEIDAANRMIRPEGASVPLAAAISTNNYAQNFTSLCSLLDDPVHRADIMGPGELATSEMTGELLFDGRQLTRVDHSAIRLGLERCSITTTDGKPLRFPVADIIEALTLLASRKRVHPVRDFLRSLKWNGEDLISEAFPKALGQSNGLCSHLLRKWIISVVARPLKPGCKVDTVLVLAGDEGLNKSTFFEALGGDWFTDAKVDIDGDNGKRIMRRSWIIEWGELDSMRRARDQEAIKAFLSQKKDVYRPLWSESLIEAPRHSVIVGTTNHREFLTDANGNRRFWPIWLDKLDIAWVRNNREQLLAQAVHLFSTGEQWWLEDDYTEVLRDLHLEHEVRDEWEELIADWAPIRNNLLAEVTGARILSEVIKKPEGQWTKGDEQRIGRVMKHLGWKTGKSRAGGRARNCFRRKEDK